MLYIDEYMYRSYTFILSFAWIRDPREREISSARIHPTHTLTPTATHTREQNI